MKRSGKILRPLIITAFFNTLIALILNFMVIRQHEFWETLTISQITGLSIWLFVELAIWVSENLLKRWRGLCIVSGLVLGLVLGGFINLGFIHFYFGLSAGYYYKNVLRYIIVFGIVFGIPITYFFFARNKLVESEKKIQEEKIKRLTMEKEAAMTTLRLLQAQIEPHFLFNTLSNVISLFDIDTEKARQMLIDVNEYLRISLQRTREELISLEQELSLVRQYLDIFKIRMGHRLEYKITNRTGLTDFSFPPLTIQPLVENAIKYGLEPKVEGGTVIIDCRREDQMLCIDVIDNGLGLEDQASETADQAGIGINNVSRRLESIYGSSARLFLTENHPSGIKATIKVPI